MRRIDDPDDYEAQQAAWEGAGREPVEHRDAPQATGPAIPRPAPFRSGDPVELAVRYPAPCEICRRGLVVGERAIGRKRTDGPGWRIFHPACHDRLVLDELAAGGRVG